MASNLTSINYKLTLSCLLGLGLSIYAYVVELAVEQDNNYTAMCDISESMSCTKAFKSDFGKGFGLIKPILGETSFLNKPNSLFGILFYSLLATLAQSNSIFIINVSLFATILSNVASLYFACILIFVLNDFCIICVSIYVVNFVNLVLLYNKSKSVTAKTVKLRAD